MLYFALFEYYMKRITNFNLKLLLAYSYLNTTFGSAISSAHFNRQHARNIQEITQLPKIDPEVGAAVV